MRAVQITEFGGPEVLRLVELPDPEAKPGQLLIDVDTIGVNYADTHSVEDSYLSRSTLPLVPGGEVAGRTADGRRVVALTATGGYAERAVAWENMAHTIPEGVSDGAALSLEHMRSRLAEQRARGDENHVTEEEVRSCKAFFPRCVQLSTSFEFTSPPFECSFAPTPFPFCVA